MPCFVLLWLGKMGVIKMRRLAEFINEYGTRQISIIRKMSSFEIGLSLYITIQFFILTAHDMLLFSLVFGFLILEFTPILIVLDKERKLKRSKKCVPAQSQ